MMKVFEFFYRCAHRICGVVRKNVDYILTLLHFVGNGVKCKSFSTHGVPYIMVSRGAKGVTIGHRFVMNNSVGGNPIGQYEKCTIFVAPGAGITIGDNVGISQCALCAVADIVIGNDVKIGGGTALYTSDFHALDADIRRSPDDLLYRRSAPITIEDDVFIGARCIIFKGCTIGARSVIGAGSVVTRSVPSDEVWAGNPARCIRKTSTGSK